MSESSSFDDREQADLVAYLDGELEGDAARAIEQKLALDPAARAEADVLKKTWDLLDFLPRPEPSPNFTHRTLERLVPVRTGSQRLLLRSRSLRLVLLGAGWIVAVVLAALGGYAGFHRLAPRAPGNPELGRDENVRPLEPVEDSDKMPVRPADLSLEQQRYLKDVLEPMLSQEEKTRLESAEGKWPDYVSLLLDLDKKHPVVLPGPAVGPKNIDGLTEPFKSAFTNLQKKPGSALKKSIQSLPGEWPYFAIELNKLFRSHSVSLSKQFGPSRPDEFAEPVRHFIVKELPPKLTTKEKEELDKVKGKWPEYPEKLRDLARSHGLEIPMMQLPGADKLRELVKPVADLPQ